MLTRSSGQKYGKAEGKKERHYEKKKKTYTRHERTGQSLRIAPFPYILRTHRAVSAHQPFATASGSGVTVPPR